MDSSCSKALSVFMVNMIKIYESTHVLKSWLRLYRHSNGIYMQGVNVTKLTSKAI